MSLAEKTQGIKNYHAEKERHPGSGYHDNDKGPGNPCSPQNAGRARISEHLIAFHAKYNVVIPGADGSRCCEAMAAYYSKWKDAQEEYDQGTTLHESHWRKAVHQLADVKIGSYNGEPALVLPAQEWNDHLEMLRLSGITISQTGVNDPVPVQK